MQLLIIENGVVVNVIEAASGNVPPDYASAPVAPEGVGIGWTVNGETYDPPAEPAITADQVKAEAERRIIAIVPAWKQRNLTAQATILAKIGEANWTPEQAAAWAAGEAIWSAVAAIRAASDVIEALDPIPQDYATNEDYWP